MVAIALTGVDCNTTMDLQNPPLIPQLKRAYQSGLSITPLFNPRCF